MERGDGGGAGFETLDETLGNVDRLEIRHDRRGWLQEAFCCITKSNFRFYNGEEKIAEAREEFTYCCRCWCAPHHPFDLTIRPTGSDSEIIEFVRPCRLPLCPWKCCCLQQGYMFVGEYDLGKVQETFYWL